MSELEQLRQRNESLELALQDLMRKAFRREMELGRKPCRHMTIRNAFLPCPHPKCFTDKAPFLYTAEQAPLPALWRYSMQDIAADGPTRPDRWERATLIVDVVPNLYSEVWAWRPA